MTESPSPTPIEQLIADWRSRAALNAKATGASHFDHRLRAVSAAQRQCAEELTALLSTPGRQPPDLDALVLAPLLAQLRWAISHDSQPDKFTSNIAEFTSEAEKSRRALQVEAGRQPSEGPDTSQESAARTLEVIATMLGWVNVPPRRIFEAEIRALKKLAREGPDRPHPDPQAPEKEDRHAWRCADCGKFHQSLTKACKVTGRPRAEAEEPPYVHVPCNVDDALDVYVPGGWKCLKCGFHLSQQTIFMQSGSIGHTREQVMAKHGGELCPNDGEPMLRETWHDRADSNYKWGLDLMEQIIAATGTTSLPAALDAIKERPALDRSPVEVQGRQLEPELLQSIQRRLHVSAAEAMRIQTTSWAVSVERNGENIVTLASNCHGGRDLSAEDERVIKLAADHLLSFLGLAEVQGRPPDRLRTLARFGALIAHENLFDAAINIDDEPTEGHENNGRTDGDPFGFKTCPHPDCVLFREVEASPGPRSAPAPTDGVRLIAAERERQQAVEGWTTQHDDEHDCGEMGQAAICYIDHAAPNDWESHPAWPWEQTWWKPSPDPIRDLVKAGALIAAEIDRLQRAVAPASPRDATETT